VRHALLAALLAFACLRASAAEAPAADHHQHLFSPEAAALIAGAPGAKPQVVTARDVVSLLDAAGIRKAVVLSFAYAFGNPARTVEDEHAKVRAENDWNAAQAAQYPDRLRAFCGLNPLKPYALQELERCARDPRLRHGIKIHFGNSDIQLEKTEHVAALRRVFAAADAHGMAIVAHLRANISKQRPYGPEQARIFVGEVLPAAPHVVVQVAHLAASGPGYEDIAARNVMATLAAAVERGDAATANLWFDVASIVPSDIDPETAAIVARFIRQVGVDRVLYGTDSALGANLRPRESWAAFLRLPLTPGEFSRIASNIAPYLR
jgi:predicted TIM-barrel fold metal-dependent hydrolase